MPKTEIQEVTIQTNKKQVLFDLDLYLLRHGDAGKGMAVAAGQDSGDVPLTIAGREEIAVIARSVKMLNLKFSAIVCVLLNVQYKLRR
jgi:hypothetical protein